jgi:AraC-like DNA-binding protein
MRGSRMSARARRSHRAIIVRFETYLEAHPDTPLHLLEICAALGTPERTLRAACEEQLGMGPIRYLNLRRMHLVRRALALADPSRATVTQLATDYGFWELGRFAVAYRALFGEPPSETLRRSSDKVFAVCECGALPEDIRSGGELGRECVKFLHSAADLGGLVQRRQDRRVRVAPLTRRSDATAPSAAPFQSQRDGSCWC